MTTLNAGRKAQEDTFILFLKKDPQANRQIVGLLTPLIGTIINRRCSAYFRTPDEREELVNEVWARLAILKPGDFDPNRGSLGTFLYLKIREARSRWLRDSGRFKRTGLKTDEGEEMLAQFSPYDEMTEEHDNGRYVDDIEAQMDAEIHIEQAPPAVVKVLKFEIYEGLSRKAAAERVGIERTRFYREMKAYRHKVLAQAA